MSEVRRDGYNYHNTYVESVEWQRDKAYARAEKLVDKLSALAANGPCGKHENAVYMSDASGTWCRICAAEARAEKAEQERDADYALGLKVTAMHSVEKARAEKLAAALREILETVHTDPGPGFASLAPSSVLSRAARALADGEGK